MTGSFKGRIAVTVIRPPDYPHSAVFAEIAETVFHGLRTLGYDTSLKENDFINDGLNIVFGANLLSQGQAADLPERSVIYNLEQIDPSSMWSRISHLLGRYPVWDYSLRNMKILGEKGYGDRVFHVPVGYVPELTRIIPVSEDIDVLFYGSVNERRQRVLDTLRREGLRVGSIFGVYGAARDACIARSKVVLNLHYYESSIFEMVRVSYLLSNSKAVVAECDENTDMEPGLEGAFVRGPYGRLIDECKALARDGERRKELQEAALRIFSKRDEKAYLRAGLEWAESFLNKDGKGKTVFDTAVNIEPLTGVSSGGDDVLAVKKDCVPGLVSIALVFSNGPKGRKTRLKDIQKSLLALEKHTPQPHEIIVACAALEGGVAGWLKKQAQKPGYKFIETGGNFAALVNRAAAAASGEYILLLEGGAEASDEWLSGMIECVKNAGNTEFPEVAGTMAGHPPVIVGPMSNVAEGLQNAEALLRNGSEGGKREKPVFGHSDWLEQARALMQRNMHCRIPVPRPDDFCLLFPRALYEKTGGLDQAFSSRRYAIWDFIQRASLQGAKCFVAAGAFVFRDQADEGKTKAPGKETEEDTGKITFDDKWSALDSQGTEAGKLRAMKLAHGALMAGQRGDLKAAVGKFVEAVKDCPPGDAVFKRGLCFRFALMLIEDGQFKQALEVLSTMPAGDLSHGDQSPQNQDAVWLELAGYCKDGLGETGEAERLAQGALRLSRRAGALNLMGLVLFRKGERDRAVSFFEEAIKADGGCAEAYSNLGAARWAEGKKDEALALFEHAFVLNPASNDMISNYYSAVMELSRTDGGVKNFERAAPIVRQSISFYPAKKRLRHISAEFCFRGGLSSEALEALEESFLAFGVDDAALSIALQIRNLVGPKTMDAGNGSRKQKSKTLSMCMIVKNEEQNQNIVRSLLNLRPVSDEMIVVDTGSTDRTKDIARALGAKVFDFEWTGDFAAARNFSLSQATGGWILVMDADEAVSVHSRKELRALLEGPVRAYSITTRNYVFSPGIWGWRPNDGIYPEQTGTGWLPSDKARLFPNDPRIRFINPVHELVERSLEEAGIKIVPSSIPVHHYGKLFGNQVVEKGKSYYELGKAKLAESGGKDLQAAHELAIQSIELGRSEDALLNWRRVAEIDPNYKWAYVGMGDSLFMLGRYREAMDVIEKGFKSPLDMLEASHLYARCMIFSGMADKAASFLEKQTSTHPMVLATLALAYICAGDKEKAKKFTRQAAKNADMYSTLGFYAKKLAGDGSTDYAIKVLESLMAEGIKHKEVPRLLGECYLRKASRGAAAGPEQRAAYALWIKNNEPDEDSLKHQREEAGLFRYRPLISLIAPVSNTPREMLLSMIKSVEAQTYDNWQLCVADGDSEPHVKELLEDLARREPRAKVRFLDPDRNASGLSNGALSMAEGEFAGFLDHDGKLAPFALYEIVKLLNRDPEADFIYSDEDEISGDGKARFNPHFKPGWSPDTMLSHNYVGFFSVIRKRVIDEAGGFREGYEGSEDHDLFLRVSRLTDEIRHIPQVLYHRRSGGKSPAQPASPTAKKAIADHLKQRGDDASVMDGTVPGTYRVKYGIKGSPEISIIIPTRDKAGLLKTCVSSILEKTSYPNYRILIVDNQSAEKETLEYFKSVQKDGRICVIQYDKPFNFAALNNFAASRCGSDFLLFLNNDTEVINGDWLECMLEHAQRERVGAVGARLYLGDNRIQHAGVMLGGGRVAFHPHYGLPGGSDGYFKRVKIIQNLSAVTGACLMMRKKVFEEAGGFDERFSHSFNDVDLCMKIREKGYLVIYTPYAELYHYESASRGRDYTGTPEKQQFALKEVEMFIGKWGDVPKRTDPYFNPNLTGECFSINTSVRPAPENWDPASGGCGNAGVSTAGHDMDGQAGQDAAVHVIGPSTPARPRVSVIISSYNYEHFIPKAIRSVLEQTYQDFEFVIVENGSTDGSLSAIKRFDDPRIRLFIFEKNQGAIPAANKLLSEARGEYLATFTADDVFMPEKLEKQVSFLDRHPETGAVFTYPQLIDDDDNGILERYGYRQDLFDQPNRSRFKWLNHFFYKGNCLCAPSALIRRECLERIGPWDPRYHQLPDLDCWIRFCLQYDIHIIPERLTKMRIHGANTSTPKTESIVRHTLESVKILRHYLRVPREDFLKVFPEAAPYREDLERNGKLLPFFLAWTALNAKTLQATYFGLDLLFDVMEDRETAEYLSRHLSFGYGDFIKLTGKYDLFNQIAAMRQQGRIEALEKMLAEQGVRSEDFLNRVQLEGKAGGEEI